MSAILSDGSNSVLLACVSGWGGVVVDHSCDNLEVWIGFSGSGICSSISSGGNSG
jgi:hypothetical protein